MLHVYPDGNIGDPESDREALKEAIEVIEKIIKEKTKENQNMMNFIELTLTDGTKTLININNIIDIHKVTESEQTIFSSLQNADIMEDYMEAFKELGMANLVKNAFAEITKGNTVIATNTSKKDGLYNIYVLEEYNDVKKMIKENTTRE